MNLCLQRDSDSSRKPAGEQPGRKAEETEPVSRAKMRTRGLGANGTDCAEETIFSAVSPKKPHNREGTYAQFGMGGYNLSADLLYKAALGMNVALQNGRSVAWGRRHDERAASLLRTSYSVGQRAARRQFNRIIRERDLLKEGRAPGSEDGYRARTIRNRGEKRTVYLESFGRTRDERLRAAVELVHESYRDGVSVDDTKQIEETRKAVTGHTKAALQLLKEGNVTAMLGDANIREDLAAYLRAKEDKKMGQFTQYIDKHYDSSADYWRLMNDGTVEWDGNHDLYNEDGELLLRYMGSKTTDPRKSLAWFLDFDDLEAGKRYVNDKMIDAKWSYVGNGEYAVGEGGSIGLDFGETLSSRMFYGVHHAQTLSDIQAEVQMYEGDATAANRAIQRKYYARLANGGQGGDDMRLASLQYYMANFLLNENGILDSSFPALKTQGFGINEEMKNYPTKDGKPFHNGSDVGGARIGTKKYSMADQPLYSGWSGRIQNTRWSRYTEYDSLEAWQEAMAASEKPLFFDEHNNQYRQYERGYGNSVIVDYGFQFENVFIPSGVSALYAHMYTIGVEQGDFVSGSSALGTAGSSGYSDGAHLHYELFTPKEWGASNIFSTFYNLTNPVDNLQKNSYYSNKIFYNTDEIWKRYYKEWL